MNNRTRAYIYITIAAISLAVITTYYPEASENIMTTLTNEQIKTVKTLVRLGDSLELAIKTVLNQKEFDVNFYKNAYEL